MTDATTLEFTRRDLDVATDAEVELPAPGYWKSVWRRLLRDPVTVAVLNLLLELRRRRSLTCLFISHDLSVVERLSDRVAIMHSGRIVESASTREVFANPVHSYTKSLLAAAPRLNRRRRFDAKPMQTRRQ